MKFNRLFASFIFLSLLTASFFFNPTKSLAYPPPGTCDGRFCHAAVLNNENSDVPGSLVNAIKGACQTSQDDLISFQSGFFIDRPTITLSQPLVIPDNCHGKIEIAGPSDVEVMIDGSSLARSAADPTVEPALSGRNDLCALYVNSNSHKIHHLTFVGAPFAVCVYGNDNQISDNNIGIHRNFRPDPNAIGIYVSGASNTILNNVIDLNIFHGMVLKGSQNRIQQNKISANGGAGIYLIEGASLNLIGGTSVLNGNTIRSNARGGVVLTESAGNGNLISHNQFSRNIGLAIDLKNNGVSLPTSGETGPNQMISMPSEVQVVPMRTEAPYDTYLFRGRAPANYFIEIYIVDPEDLLDVHQLLGTQSYGEGNYFLTSQRVLPARDGKFSVLISNSLLGLGSYVSAIIRDGAGNTSEFSATLELQDLPNPRNPNCGNGVLDAGETCDDRNIISGDGCSSICSVEPGFHCEGSPSRCSLPVSLCGNGHLDAGEACDDGNRAESDGCSGTCGVESGWTCTGEPSHCTRPPTPTEMPPISPETLIAEATGPRSIDVSFKDQSLDESGFRIDRADGECGAGRREAEFNQHFTLPAQAGMSLIHYTDNAVEPDHTYCYRAVALRGSLSSSPTNLDDAHTLSLSSSTLTPPSDLTAEATAPNNVRVIFKDNSDNETGFKLERANGACRSDSVFTLLATISPAAGILSRVTYEDASVLPGSTYCYEVRATHSTGESTPSNMDDATTPVLGVNCGNAHLDAGEACDDNNTANGDGCNNSCQVESGWTCSGSPSHCNRNSNPPSNLRATLLEPPSRVRVTFTDNSDNETSFAIDRAEGECRADSSFTQIGTAPSLAGTGQTVLVEDSTVQAGRTYCYRARALTPAGSTAPSNAASVMIPLPSTTPDPGTSAGRSGGIADSLEGGGCALNPSPSSPLLSFISFGILLLGLSILRKTKKVS